MQTFVEELGAGSAPTLHEDIRIYVVLVLCGDVINSVAKWIFSERQRNMRGWVGQASRLAPDNDGELLYLI